MITIRLASHGLDKYRFSTAKEVVEHFGCIQAQDIGQALWVIGSRLSESTESVIVEFIRKGEIVRTWPMRGTLHYMNPQNVHWMLSLCASKTLSGFSKRREFLGISDKYAEKALEVMSRELRGGKVLSRTELTKTLEVNGIPMQTQWMYHLACYAATRGLICFGPPAEKEETFVLLDEWVKNPLKPNHDEQLAELARMYFRGHGPATVDDFAWWCGLGKTECKKGIELIRNELRMEEYEGKPHYFSPSITNSGPSGLRLIGGFDEYFLGYKDRSPVADLEHHGKLFTSNGIFFPLIIQDGQVIGSWKREFKKDIIIIRINMLPGFSYDKKTLEKECERYTKFSGYEKSSLL